MERSLAWNNKGNATVDQIIFLRSKGQNVTGLLMGGRGEKSSDLLLIERSTVQRTAQRGPFLTVARARERITIYINGYSNITHRAQKERQGWPEQTPRVIISLNLIFTMLRKKSS